MSCRVTVVGTKRRLDADLPDAIPVAELVADVAGLLGENQNGAVVDWGLFKVGGARLDPELSLADQGVFDGSMLFLRDAATAPAPPDLQDFAGRVAVAVDAQRGRFTATTPAAILAWIAAITLGAAGLTVLVASDAGGRATAGLLGAVISGLLTFAVRFTGRTALARVVIFGALPVWIAAGAGIAELVGANAPVDAAFGLAAAALGGLAAMAIVGESALVLTDGVLESTAVPAVVLGVTSAFGGGFLEAAAVLVVVELALLATLPVVNARLLRAASEDTLALVRRLYKGRRVAAASCIADSVVAFAACAVLATSGGWFARGLVAATAMATALRARHHRFAGEVIPLVAAGIADLLLLELPLAGWLAIGVRGAAGLALLLIADAIVLVGIGVLVRRWSLPAQVIRWLRPLDFGAVAATVPLALGVLGLYDAVAHFARGLG